MSTSISNPSDDIQAAGSDTRPPMLDRTDYESWAQRIRLYCQGKENGENILRSIDEGLFQMGTTRDVVTTGEDGTVTLGIDRPRTYRDLTEDERKRYDADIRASNIIIQGLPKDVGGTNISIITFLFILSKVSVGPWSINTESDCPIFSCSNYIPGCGHLKWSFINGT